jgi:hypothetical protein
VRKKIPRLAVCEARVRKRRDAGTVEDLLSTVQYFVWVLSRYVLGPPLRYESDVRLGEDDRLRLKASR